MDFDVLTLYPEMFSGPMGLSILGRAQESQLLRLHLHQIRNYAQDKHHSVDDTPFGGGAGMVMRFDVLEQAWQAAKNRDPNQEAYTILLSPQGQPLRQSKVERLVKGEGMKRSFQRLILVCGRFEGIDERFIEACVDEELSIGDYILSGGELAAMVLVDAITRLIPGVLGNRESLATESFSSGNERILECPQYTQPREYLNRKVPEVLLSGDHAKIATWRRNQAIAKTRAKRPDLLFAAMEKTNPQNDL